tara:strand:- start:20 stop:541 length:522 start_codon:yes stop_codon:yes gene_type:complete
MTDSFLTPSSPGELNNQANSHSHAYYGYKVGNAKFKTESEKFFHKALLDIIENIEDNSLIIVPLPLTISFKGEANSHPKIGQFNIEPDWMIFYLGINLVLELDGLSHSEKSPALEQDRLLPFDMNNFNIKRIDAPIGDLTHIELKEWARKEALSVINYIRKKFFLKTGGFYGL